MPEAFAEDAQEHEEREPSERKRERADDHPRTVPAVEEISAPGSVRLVAVRCIRGQHEADNEKHDEGDRGDTAPAQPATRVPDRCCCHVPCPSSGRSPSPGDLNRLLRRLLVRKGYA